MVTERATAFVRLGNCDILERAPERLVLRKRELSSVRWTMGGIVGLALVGAAAILFQWIDASPAAGTAVILFACLVVATATWMTFELPRLHIITFDGIKGEMAFSFRDKVTQRIPFGDIARVDVQHQRIWSRERGEENYWLVNLQLRDGVTVLIDCCKAAADQMSRLAAEIDAVLRSFESLNVS